MAAASGAIKKKVSSRAVKDKAQELMPEVFGVAPSWERDGDDYPVAFKKHEAKISSWCHRFLKRHRVASLCENPNPIKKKRIEGRGRGRWGGRGGGGASGGGACSNGGEDEDEGDVAGAGYRDGDEEGVAGDDG